MSRRRSHLRVLVSGRASAGEQRSGLGPAVGAARPVMPQPRRTAAGRPWDELAPWWLPTGPATARLTAAAGAAGLDIGLAASLIIERSLACRDLERIGRGLPSLLDERARDAAPDAAVSGSTAAYLRQLLGNGGIASRTRQPWGDGPVSLPGRVTLRLADASDEEVAALLDGELRLAIAWERAAVLDRRTIGEWAALHGALLLSWR
jgi:hypothetical protein